jgi:aldehyde dehydrogenase (NAD+)
VLLGRADVGATLVADSRVALVSATGSTAWAAPWAKPAPSGLPAASSNWAATTPPSSRPRDAGNGAARHPFAAVGTAGQRCTTLRRLLVHASVYDALVPRLQAIYGKLRIGTPLDEGTLVGPLIDAAAFDAMQAALADARAAGGHVTGGERVMRSLRCRCVLRAARAG